MSEALERFTAKAVRDGYFAEQFEVGVVMRVSAFFARAKESSCARPLTARPRPPFRAEA